MKRKIISFLILLGVFALGRFALADWSDGLSIAESFELPDNSVETIISALLLWLLAIFTLLAVIAFIITGIMFLMAGSNADMKTRAKDGVTYSIVGITVGLSGYIIVRFIDDWLTDSLEIF